MTDRWPGSSRRLAMSTLIGLTCGCVHSGRKDDCRTESEMLLAAPIPWGAPVVQVVGDHAPSDRLRELQMLTNEIRDALTDLGGLRIAQVREMNSNAVCDSGLERAYDHQVAVPSDGLVRGEWSEAPTAAADQPVVVPLETRPDMPTTDAIRVSVRIDEFVPYRPQRLRATFVVMDARSGQEISTLQGTWNSTEPGHRPGAADAHWSLKACLSGPPGRATEEYSALAALSPGLFLRSVAIKVAPAIHLACLPAPCLTIE